MNTLEAASHVQDKESFIAFLEALASYCKSQKQEIENQSVDTFLAGVASWLEDSPGFYTNQGRPTPVIEDWRPIAEMLAAGLYYE